MASHKKAAEARAERAARMRRYRVTIDISATSPEVASSLAAIMAGDMSEHPTLREIDPRVVSVTPIERTNLTVVHTDGGCDLRRDGVGAYAAVVERPDRRVMEIVGWEAPTTNNRMEMRAVIEALRVLDVGPPVLLVMDSEYVMKGATLWARNWQRNGWRTHNGKDVLNRDLWEELLKLHAAHNVRFQVVRGHSGVAGNERCDQLCTEAMRAGMEQIRRGEPWTPEASGPTLTELP